MQGVSGCGVWRLWENARAGELASWDESWIQLVGIEHRVAGEAIIGTLALHVVKMMIETQPVELTLSDRGFKLRVR